MSARLERIARMSPDDRFEAVASFIEGAAILGDYAPLMGVTYRRSRVGERQTVVVRVMGVARNDNGTSFGELIVRLNNREPYRLYGIGLANVDALESAL